MFERDILNETISVGIKLNTYIGLPSIDSQVWLYDNGSWYEGITGESLPGLIKLTNVDGESLFLSDELILDAQIMRLNIELFDRVVRLSRGDTLDDRVRTIFLSQGYDVQSLPDVRNLVLKGMIYTARSLLTLLTDFENAPEFLSENVRKHIIATEIGFFSNDNFSFDNSLKTKTYMFMDQFKKEIGFDFYASGTYDQFAEFFLAKLESNDYSPFSSLSEFESNYREFIPKSERFLNLNPLFNKGVFRVFDRYFTVLDKQYSIETGWVYKLDNGWWVQEFMGVISSRNTDDVRILQYKLIPEDNLYFNFSNDSEKPRVFYKFVDIHDHIWGVHTVSGQSGGMLTTELINYDNYKTKNTEILPFGYTRSDYAHLGHTYKDQSDGSYWLVAEIYKNSEDEFVICLIDGTSSPARRIKDSDFSYTMSRDEIPYKIGTEVQCLVPGLEFDHAIVGATVTSQIGSAFYNYCAVIREGEGTWYPWSVLSKIGFLEDAFHVPKNITGFVSYSELERPGIMYLEDVIDIELPKLSSNSTRIGSIFADKIKITPTEKAIVEKKNYVSNTILWAGGASVLILAINVYVAQR